MININRSECPTELTEDHKKKLTQKFIDTKDSVWAVSYIKKPLFEMSHGKCSYCEGKLGEEGKYMHVEHFHHKDAFPNEVVEWNNLLPSCVHCNTNKGTHNTIAEPIIDPTITDPREHMIIENYRYKSKNNSTLGKKTIEVIYLNSSDQLVTPRFDIANKSLDTLQDLLDKAIEFQAGTNISTKRRNIIINGLKSLLREAHPKSQYSAIVATTILKDSYYLELKNIIIGSGLWDYELQTLETEVRDTSLY
ncbi:HNH endonuclease [Paenibacillus sp. GCM10012307]|uniref:HNH domain-containing protein n=1 Tax=Paenibacillus roseus TaxID=2798579 RepID=A0A934J1C5_9BACL|nr:HNH endonuclease [Paenibacillus roseus]MBJ6361499.1 hypothetical protein [Paenibacillus roseus]